MQASYCERCGQALNLVGNCPDPGCVEDVVEPSYTDKSDALDKWGERLKLLVAKIDGNSAALFDARPEDTGVLRSVVVELRGLALELEAALNADAPADPRGLKLMEDE